MAVNSADLVVGFAGLTSAGIVAAAAAASKGVRAIAFDGDITRTAALRRGELPIDEPGLKSLIESNRERIEYTATAADLSQCALVYVFIDTPADENGQRDLSLLKTFFRDVAAASRADAVLVLIGPIPPGCTRAHVPKGRSVFYQAQAASTGRSVEQALEPKQLIIGCADPVAPLPAPLAAHLAAFDCPILRMRYESAELARVALDMLLASSISVVHTLTELCEKTGADWAEIVPTLKAETSFAPALSFSEELERDLAGALTLAERHAVDGGVIEAYLASNRRRRDWLLQRLEEHVLARTPDARLALVGARPDDKSTVAALLAALPKLKVRIYAPEMPLEGLPNGAAESASDPLEACAQADALVILAPCPEVAALDLAAMAERMRGRVIIDPYRVLDPETVKRAELAHHVLGRGSS